VASDAFYEAYVEVVPTARGFERSLNKQLQGPSTSAGGAAGGAAGAGFVGAFGKAIPIIGGILAAAGLGDMISTAIEDAGTYQQAQGAVESVFGKLGADAIKAFAEGGAQSVGQSMNDILSSSSLLGVFGKAAGLAGGDLVDFSTDLITLGADLSAFANTTPEEAVEALSAGLRGESEPLRKYGVLLDDATLKARAMEMGIYDGNGPLTQQQRILAAYNEILAQTTDQQGTFASESDTLAGQQARTAAAWENISTMIGTAFLPVAEDLSKWFLDEGIPALEEFADWLNSPETQEGIDNFKIMLQEVGNFLRDWVINPIMSTIGIIDVFVQAANGVSFEELKQKLFELPGFWGAVFQAAWSAGEGIGTVVGTVIGTVKKFAFEVGQNIGIAVQWFQSLPRLIGEALSGAGSWLYSVGRNVIQGFVNGITSMVRSIYTAITDTVGGAIDWAKDLLGIQSPSKVFQEIGEYTSQGFARGIESEYGMVRSAASGMAGAAAEGVSFDGARIDGLLEIGGDGLGRIIDGRMYAHQSAQNQIDDAGRRRR
jgi:phage-related minor tail protein